MPQLIIADRVLETSTGTGSYTVAGAELGFRAFSVVCGTNDFFTAVDASGRLTGDWETGLGTYSAANTITRTAVHASSNANGAVNWAAGTKRVALSVVAGLGLAGTGGGCRGQGGTGGNGFAVFRWYY